MGQLLKLFNACVAQSTPIQSNPILRGEPGYLIRAKALKIVIVIAAPRVEPWLGQKIQGAATAARSIRLPAIEKSLHMWVEPRRRHGSEPTSLRLRGYRRILVAVRPALIVSICLALAAFVCSFCAALDWDKIVDDPKQADQARIEIFSSDYGLPMSEVPITWSARSGSLCVNRPEKSLATDLFDFR